MVKTRTSTDPAPDYWTDFLLEDYKLKIGYLTAQFGRMWNRFQYFIVFEGVLSTVFFGFIKERRNADAGWVAVTGATVAACWYVFGAQDKRLVEVYRSQIRYVLRELFARSNFSIPLCFDEDIHAKDGAGQDAATYPCYPATGGTDASGKIPGNPLCWRFDFLSVTYLAAGFPVLVFVFWTYWAIKLWT
jgi:hypothetical protein